MISLLVTRPDHDLPLFIVVFLIICVVVYVLGRIVNGGND